MSEYCMIETAFDDKKELQQVVDDLLNSKLVASDSKWCWKNGLENSKEYLIFMKTKRDLAKEIFETIKKFHSYECFEFAIFELESCNDEYLKWIDEETK